MPLFRGGTVRRKVVGGIEKRFLIKLLLIAAAYFVSARLGLALAVGTKQITTVWPPTALALAALLLFGYRYWPAVAAGAFAANLLAGETAFEALGVAAGNTLEALTGIYLLQRFAGITPKNVISTTRNIVSLVVLAALVSTTVSATVGTLSLTLGGTLPWPSYPHQWLTWWVGDMLGDLIFTPVIFGLSNNDSLAVVKQKPLQALSLLLITVAAALLIFGQNATSYPPIRIFPYIIFPILLWAAFEFMQAGVAIVLLALDVIAVWATVRGLGPFSNVADREMGLVVLQVFLFVASVTSLIVATVVAERLRIASALRTSEELNKAKDEFISLASHELRTPATIVKLYLGMLIDGYLDGELSKKQKRALLKAHAGNERQLKIINDLLGVAKIDSGTLVRQDAPTDVAKLITELVRESAPSFGQRRQKILFTPAKRPLYVLADPALVKIALSNLLDNASKYTPNAKKIRITVKRQPERVRITISDEGVGIMPENIPKLFEKFARFDNELSAKVGGSGIGLYWTKKIVEYYAGDISVNSEPGTGSTFTVSLPRISSRSSSSS